MYKKLTTLVLLFGLAGMIGLTGCKKEEEGAMEKAGEKADEAMKDAKDAAEELGQ